MMLRLRSGVILLVVCALLGIGFAGQFASVIAQPRPDADSPKLYLPLLLVAWPPPTPTLTPSPTPTSTPTSTPTTTPESCPVDNVTGIYAVQTSNTKHNCPLPIEDMAGEGRIIQTGEQLILVFQDITTTGAIDTSTGEFSVSADTPTAKLSASGVFALGQNPMMVSGQAELILSFGPTSCTVTFDLVGERQSCQAGPGSQRLLRVLPFADKERTR